MTEYPDSNKETPIQQPAVDTDFTREFRQVRKSLVLIAGVLSLSFFGLAVVYVQWMAPTVEGLSGRIGELAYFRAREMQEAGEVAAAVDLYEEALTRRFDDPRQRGWAQRHFGELLNELERYEEATEVLEACVADFPEDFQAWRLLVHAYQQLSDYDAAAAVGAAWYRLAGEVGAKENRGHAAYHYAMSLLQLGDEDAALAMFREGYALNPRTENAFRAAVLHERRGEYEEARVLFAAYVGQRSGQYIDDARSRLEQLREQG